MFNTTNISSEFIALIQASGWTPDRKCNIDRWLHILHNDGFMANSLAIDILESWGGLNVFLPSNPPFDPYTHHLLFNPMDMSGEYDRCREWETQIGITLFPVGYIVEGSNAIWAGSDGAIYTGVDFGLYCVGRDLKAATRLWAISDREMEKVAD